VVTGDYLGFQGHVRCSILEAAFYYECDVCLFLKALSLGMRGCISRGTLLTRNVVSFQIALCIVYFVYWNFWYEYEDFVCLIRNVVFISHRTLTRNAGSVYLLVYSYY
jgi:hypothetical protein